MNNKKLNLDNYIHFGFATYEEYFEVYGDVESVEDTIVEDTKKYLELIRNGYKYTLDKIMSITDISNRTTIQTKFTQHFKAMYIVKPVKNLIYVLLNEEKYYEQYQLKMKGSYIDFLIDTEGNNNILRKKIMDFYDLDLRGASITKEFIRKKLFFRREDLKASIKEVFKISDGETYIDIPDRYLNRIIRENVKSQKTLVDEYGLLGTTQFNRYIRSGKIVVDLKIVIPCNSESKNKRDMARYLIGN